MKASIKRTLTKSVLVVAVILALTSIIINAVFAAVDLRIPVEIIWNDPNDSARPAQVTLHVRRSGSTEDLKTVTLTNANVDSSNPNRWTTTITGIDYDPNYSYAVYQDSVTGYSITQSSNVSVETKQEITSYNHQSFNGNHNQTYQGTNFILVSRNNNSPILWTLESYDLSALNSLIENVIGSGHAVGQGDYYSGSTTSTDFANITYNSNNDTVSFNLTHGGSIDVYYGEIITYAQGSTASFTNTINIPQYNLTVHHRHENGTSFAADTVMTYYSGQTYTAEPIVDSRHYTSELQSGQATGVISQDTEVTYVYHPILYNVVYQFTGDVLPPSSSSLLPSTVGYLADDTVNVAAEPNATGYRFLGWTMNGQSAGTSFIMPDNHVTISGSWERFNGFFSPTISKQITNPQNIYRIGDTVEFQIYVTNTANFSITNVEVEENLIGATFVAASGYTLVSNTKALIASIPAGATAVLYAEYTVAEDVTQTLTNSAQITSAGADNYYYLDTSQAYIASVQFDIQSWQDAPVLTGVKTSKGTILFYSFLLLLGVVGIGVKCVVIYKHKITEREK